MTRLSVAFVLLFGLAPQAGGQCPSPLPERIVESLYIVSLYPTLELTPGASAVLRLSALQPDVDDFDLERCVAWHVDGRGLVAIDPATGVVTVDEAAPPGWTFVLFADVENGRRVLGLSGLVYSPARDPLVGVWREESRYDCASGGAIRDGERINELVFRADGSFYVTRQPFEVYRDYQGRYVADPESRRLAMRAIEGNVLPRQIDGFGTYRIDDRGRLVLSGISLGKFPNDERRACRYVFTH